MHLAWSRALAKKCLHKKPAEILEDLVAETRDFAEKDPSFAIEAGIATLGWLAEGYG